MIDKLTIVTVAFSLPFFCSGTVSAQDSAVSDGSVNWFDPRFLQIWVTAGAAFLGFVAATAGKHWFDRLTDKRRRETEVRQLAAELLAELRFVSVELWHNKTMVADMIEMWRKSAESVPPDILARGLKAPPTQVFDASIGRLGLLDPKTSALVIEVFCNVQKFDHFAERMAAWDEERRRSHGALMMFLRRRHEWIEALIEDLDTALSETAQEEPMSANDIEELAKRRLRPIHY